jgi:hypothetical protein
MCTRAILYIYPATSRAIGHRQLHQRQDRRCHDYSSHHVKVMPHHAQHLQSTVHPPAIYVRLHSVLVALVLVLMAKPCSSALLTQDTSTKHIITILQSTPFVAEGVLQSAELPDDSK